ncbi:ER membrane glycoprotein subunit of the GPI transamidase complex-like protein [Tieghemiomyces parasiticus]|uniref:GPI mannosyltransferase 2 n=1 Tax=Tieghemiomyces parasiticus TaxID=78921 RepID=A0A9W7ZVM0_9FUNG|nr:ER membrane glycoprotein subunit of the GPI transamidase complex-like protein [Tieghemiomyces parasiticus]
MPSCQRTGDRTYVVARIAVLSRLLVILLAFLSNALVDDYDSSFDLVYEPLLPTAFNPQFLPTLTKPPDARPVADPLPAEPKTNDDETTDTLDPQLAVVADPASVAAFDPVPLTRAQQLLKPWLRVFVRWDAIYFVHLAEEGQYVYEQEHAFFPMLPMTMRVVATYVLYPLLPGLGFRISVILAGVLISNLAFVGSAVVLYRLGQDVVGDDRLAYLAALCYCFTPASAFMSAIYTESLFALLSFICFRLVARRRYLQAAYFVSLSSLTRSNALTYCGFFAYDLAVRPLRPLLLRLHGAHPKRSIAATVWPYLANLLRVVFYCLVSLTGFTLFQYYGYQLYCTGPAPPRPWCHARVPLLYSFVQTHYWNNGFLKYYEVKQIPNFLFASPMVTLSFAGIFSYARADWRRFLTLGLVRSASTRPAYHHSALLPHVYLWLVLLLYATLNMHIQIITRFFSSQPMVYWYSAHLLLQRPPTGPAGSDSRWPRAWWSTRRLTLAGSLLLCYYTLYGTIGIVLFSNFFPPA